MPAPGVAKRVSTVPEYLHDFFRSCERLLDNAPDLALSDEDRKRICFYTNEIAKLTDSRRLSVASNGSPDGYLRHSARHRDSRSA